MSDLDNQESLFKKGIDSFNSQRYYDAHEFWEELWSEHLLKDALFVQGLIQASVAYFHITNFNLKGSRNLFNKSLPKLKKFPSNHRNFNLIGFISELEKSKDQVSIIEKTKDFNWDLAPRIVLEK